MDMSGSEHMKVNSLYSTLEKWEMKGEKRPSPLSPHSIGAETVERILLHITWSCDPGEIWGSRTGRNLATWMSPRMIIAGRACEGIFAALSIDRPLFPLSKVGGERAWEQLRIDEAIGSQGGCFGSN
jgi:hypothetical protein